MLAPHPDAGAAEGPGMFALETAMDELAYAIGVDPVELRLANDTQVDPANGKPFSSRKLRECLVEGAERFGWSHGRWRRDHCVMGTCSSVKASPARS